jgi:NAD(P)-dependent dehydrogenase (short-subunit alcohol dehydrogenase family)
MTKPGAGSRVTRAVRRLRRPRPAPQGTPHPVALITGAGNGIGRATARELALRGYRLALTDIDGAALQDVTDELGESVCLGIEGDVTDFEQMQQVSAAAIDRFDGIDVVIANAGISSYGSVSVVDPAAFRRVIDVNVLGAFHAVRAALPSLVDRGGYILIVSSLAAYVSTPGVAAYNTSKAATEHFANVLRLELAGRGVGVGSAHMSWIDTPLMRDATADLPATGDAIQMLPRLMRRPTTAEQCAAIFADGIAARRRRVFVPRWVAVLAIIRPLLVSAVAERVTLGQAGDLLDRMDAELERLGRPMSARYTGDTS